MASSTSSVSSSTTTPTFNGSSTYSSSFQQVLTRAVQEASLPMQQLQNNVNDLTNQQSALTQLETTFNSLDSAIQSIDAATSGNPAASVSDPSIVSAATTSSALPGTYSIQVDTLGSYATALSQAGSPAVTDPTSQSISSANTFTLSVGAVNTTITPASNSLEGLATAINASSAGVQATIVNVGSNTSADYRLVITNDTLGQNTIQLNDGSNLMSSVADGADATYSVNGSSTVLSSNSRQVTLSPGLTVTMLAASTQPDTITVTTDYTALSNALSSFATAYNAAVTAVNAQIGQNAGPLAGDSIIGTLNGMLHSLIQYSSGAGPVASLNDLGLSVDENGVMSYDASTFTGLNIANVAQFLGSDSASGFLQTASGALTSAVDTSSGSIETEYGDLQTQINAQNASIQTDQSRITDMETNLESELTQADAAIATLESQKTYMTDLFNAEYPSSTTG
jgi:flagellar hook-associated protein 2